MAYLSVAGWWSDLIRGEPGRFGTPPRLLPGAGFGGTGVFAAPDVFAAPVLARAGFEGAGFDCPAFTGTDFDFGRPDAGLRDFELDFSFEAMG
jgi:hypothetical protein